MLEYGFFDYKYNIQNFGSDLFSIPHFIFIAIAISFTIVFGIFFRKTKHSTIDIFLKILSIVMIVLEATKISWESYYDITTGRGFNYEGLLPIYTCSLFIYTVFLSAWTKGKIRDYSLSFVTTIAMVSGAIGVVYCNGLNFYPFWTFGAFYSMFFHSIMFFTGFFLLITGYKKLEWSDILRGWVPMLVLAVITIPVDYIIGADYMQIYSGDGVPLLEGLGKIMAEAGLRPLFTALMLALYTVLSGLVVSVCKLCYALNKKYHAEKI